MSIALSKLIIGNDKKDHNNNMPYLFLRLGAGLGAPDLGGLLTTRNRMKRNERKHQN